MTVKEPAKRLAQMPQNYEVELTLDTVDGQYFGTARSVKFVASKPCVRLSNDAP